MDVASLSKAVTVFGDDRLYAMIDCARDPALVEAARNTPGVVVRSLLIGTLGDAISDAAPYIVALTLDSPFFAQWAARFGSSAGILLTTPADMDTLFEHLRDIFIARTEDGEKYYFRFYDPRVLRVFLPTCTREEVGHFFGPIRVLYVEGEDPGVLLKYRNGPAVQRIPLEAGGRPEA